MARLKQLDARFIRSGPNEEDRFFYVDVLPGNANGLMFVCPNASCRHLIIMWFENPHAGTPVAPKAFKPYARWKRTGETLETLTVLQDYLGNDKCGWRGSIANGEVT